MLVYDAVQVLAIGELVVKDYSFRNDDGKEVKGTSNYADATMLSADGSVAVIRFKGKTTQEVKDKAAKLTVGKAAKVRIVGMDQGVRGVLVLNA